MNKEFFKKRIKSLQSEINKNIEYLTICRIDEIVKSGDLIQVMFFSNCNKQQRYLCGEIKGTTRIKPRFKFHICREDEVDLLSKDKLNELTLFAMRKKWAKWNASYYKDNNPLDSTFQNMYMIEMEKTFNKNCFFTIELK